MTEQYIKYWEFFIKQKSGAISPEELAEYTSWINADSKHEAAIREFEEIYAISDAVTDLPSFDPKDEWDELQTIINIEESHKSGSVRLFPWFARIAAAVILVLGFTFIFYQYKKISPDQLNLQTMVQTDGTDQKIVELPDGTTVWLNKNSELLYPEKFDNDTRTIYLKGEAFFEVTRDEKRPFTVHSGISNTTV